MLNKVTEYCVSFAVKEWLIENKWDILAFNPPGSQGTFTIPNPSKMVGYRGQSGSNSPDIVAIYHGEKLLMIESKPAYVASDVSKLVNFKSNLSRMSILMRLIEGVANANDIEFHNDAIQGGSMMIAIAIGSTTPRLIHIPIFEVFKIDNMWDHEYINAKTDPYEFFRVKYYAPNE